MLVASTMKGARCEVGREKGKMGLVEGEGMEGYSARKPDLPTSTAAMESSSSSPSTIDIMLVGESRGSILTSPPKSRSNGGDVKGAR